MLEAGHRQTIYDSKAPGDYWAVWNGLFYTFGKYWLIDLALFLKVSNLTALGAVSPDTFTQIKIWAHSANIPDSFLWIDTLMVMFWYY